MYWGHYITILGSLHYNIRVIVYHTTVSLYHSGVSMALPYYGHCITVSRVILSPYGGH